MGSVCFKNKSSAAAAAAAREAAAKAAAYNPWLPSDESALRALPSLLLIGPAGAGKTCLFASLVFGPDGETASGGNMLPTAGHHCEITSFNGTSFWVWDSVGEPEVLRDSWISLGAKVWFRGVFIVLSMLDINGDADDDSSFSRLNSTRRTMKKLMSAVQFDASNICIVFNTHDSYAEEATPYQLTIAGQQAVQKMLRTYDVGSFIANNAHRTMWITCNVKDANDPRLSRALNWMFDV